MTGVYNGYRTLDVSIPSGSVPSSAVDLGEDEIWIGTITPSDWVTSNINVEVTQDNGVSWNALYASAGNKQGYFSPTQASRAFIASLGLSNIAPRKFRLVSINDQLSAKTLTLLIMDR